MKLTGILAAAAMAVGAFAKSDNSTMSGSEGFNLTALNGTWHMAGITTALYKEISLITAIYNMTLSCPQIYITGNSTNTSYIQPSLVLGWYNDTTQQSESANVSLSGLMTLNSTGSNATFAQFHALFSMTFANQHSDSSGSNSVKMLDATFSSGNSSNPLPNGPDFEADLNVTLASSFNNATNDVVLIRAYNFTSDDTYGYGTGPGGNSDEYDASGYGISDMYKVFASLAKGRKNNTTGPVFTGLFVNVSDTLGAKNFTAVTTDLGNAAANLTRLNDTCTSTSSSSGSSYS